MLESRHIGEPSPPPIPQLQLPNGAPYPPPQNHYMHPPGMSYTPPPPPQQADYSPRIKQQQRELAGPSSASSSKTTLSMRGRPPSSRPSGSSSSEPRQRKRARNAQTAPQPDEEEAQYDGHARAPEHQHNQQQHQQQQQELPPSPYSSTSQRSLSSEGSAGTSHAQKHPRERGAMAIGSLLSESAGGGSKMEVEREDGWTNGRAARHSSAENSPRLSKVKDS